MEIEHEADQEGCLFPSIGKPFGKEEAFLMDDKTWLQTHRYVLFNCASKVVEDYRNEHISEIKRTHRKRRLSPHQLDRLHFNSFHEWFKDEVSKGFNY
ncbi:hypothetical protein S245_036819 [Arachis hypogaea]